MALRTAVFADNEWYHCYTRTIDHSRPFDNPFFTSRFLETLYFANSGGAMPNIPRLKARFPREGLFSFPRKDRLVAIGCYCIMPTHYHLLLQPISKNGVSEFMHKVGTGFTRFYNEQTERVGNLFIKPFRAKHIDDDVYLEQIVRYIHLNPAELFEPQWKNGIIRNMSALERKLRLYEHSSLAEHEGRERPESSIVDLHALSRVRNNTANLRETLKEAAEYYQFLELDL